MELHAVKLNSGGAQTPLTLVAWEVMNVNGRMSFARGAATEFLGTPFRWLAPIGAADFDGDGRLEFAYVEKPHLDKILHIVRRKGNSFDEILRIPGVTNHAIGQEKVESRIDFCPDGPLIIAMDASGQTMLSIGITDGQQIVKVIGPTPRTGVLGATRGC